MGLAAHQPKAFPSDNIQMKINNQLSYTSYIFNSVAPVNASRFILAKKKKTGKNL